MVVTRSQGFVDTYERGIIKEPWVIDACIIIIFFIACTRIINVYESGLVVAISWEEKMEKDMARVSALFVPLALEINVLCMHP